MEVVHTIPELRAAVARARQAGQAIGFVPTMGALHAGHASLVDRAAADCADVAVSIFVNPTQFGPGEDFGRYPRMLEADSRLLERQGVRWIFAPRVEDLYPPGAATRVVVEGPALPFEGAIRPGHFSGVATVVCRLFTALPADVAYFGAKDWQQTLVVKRMVRDLGLPVDVVVCPTMREPDGLALSSRNAYLDAADRGRAVVLHESLELAERLWHAGTAVGVIERGMRDLLEARGVAVDYAAVVDAESLGPLPSAPTPAVALVAGRLGSTHPARRLGPARRRVLRTCGVEPRAAGRGRDARHPAARRGRDDPLDPAGAR
ncbi:MAG: pantoate--beta-alanine ligase [Planctomycetia bacterium]|nr:pantoate--beta-alanine ligase [Planctomycetia bacterium]